jgi:ABC-type multidrug transport system fused ATPase/permease subunit
LEKKIREKWYIPLHDADCTKFRDWYWDASSEEYDLDRRLQNLQNLAKSTTARAELMIFDAKEWIVKHYREICGKVTKAREEGRFETKQEEPPFFHRHVFPLLHSAARGMLYLTVAYQPDYFRMSISQLSFLESSIDEVFTSLSYIRQSLSEKLVKDLFRIRNLCECMEMKSRILPPDNPAQYVSHPNGMKIEFRNVSFRYNDTAPLVLKDVNFTLEPGQIISVVGYNGSGTTSH